MSIHGKDTLVLANQYNLSSFLDNSETEAEIEVLDATTYGNNSHIYALGHDDGMATIDGLSDTEPDEIDRILSALKRTSGAIVSIVRGNANNDLCDLISAIETEISTKASVTGLVRITGGFQSDQDGLDYGLMLHALAARIATGTTTAQNNGAATTNGGVGHLHITAASGATPPPDVIIEDSADGSTGWATILTFSQKTAAGSQRVEITGTVRQYLRVSYTIGGSGPSFTFATGFARR